MLIQYLLNILSVTQSSRLESSFTCQNTKFQSDFSNAFTCAKQEAAEQQYYNANVKTENNTGIDENVKCSTSYAKAIQFTSKKGVFILEK